MGARAAPASPGEQLRAVMRRQVSTVAVVTTSRLVGGRREPVGCTVTSLCSVSLHPPLVSFCLRSGSRTERAWRGSERGVVHLLHEGQQELAARFASGAAHFAPPLGWRWEACCPVLDDALARLRIARWQRVPLGDHVLVVARVTAAEQGERRAALLYGEGHYATSCNAFGCDLALLG